MEPAIQENSAVITRSSESYEINDIITFKNPVDLAKTITHRIVGKSFDNGEYFVTRGDANDTDDPWQIYTDIIEGRVIFKIPFIGYAVSFVQKPAGLVIGMIIPSGLLVFWETEVLYKEIRRIKDVIYKRSMRRRLFIRRSKLRLQNWLMRVDEIFSGVAKSRTS
ncbi:signal peptidase I [candidate division WWE3 bacterium RIFCSPLOWO2_01_FULL_39_13]|uniref:Signal peptidase I n=1 Tax=candidate division WWE3 bacterium RIFCSPLOWO2_01_FULL_39_13 TaxID=1802624 RepID=A0A1F4V510_UNCKA|nr:MAG: signal peptidase I [candidate division WWE3 bacterium RIFCSPLOWO2_01_FULL_39_13]